MTEYQNVTPTVTDVTGAGPRNAENKNRKSIKKEEYE